MKKLLVRAAYAVLFAVSLHGAAFASSDPAVDCKACHSYPGLCGQIDTCVKSCNLSPFQAKNCFEAKKITKEHCDKLYPKCIDFCGDQCEKFPTVCGQLDKCVAECKTSKITAEQCFQKPLSRISLEKCKSIYPACKERDSKCVPCMSYPGLCGEVGRCVKECNLAPFQAQNCFQAHKISKEQCTAIYPACK